MCPSAVTVPASTRIALHWRILAGLVLGALTGGLVAAFAGPVGVGLITTYLKPVGTIFIRLITMIAAPLVLASLIVGASSINDKGKLGRIGVRTIVLFLATTALAITIGVLVASVMQPGAGLPRAVSARLLAGYSAQAAQRIESSRNVSLIDQIVAIVPTNPFEALATGQMLQIVCFALICGIALTLIPAESAEPVIRVCRGVTDMLIRIVDLVMRIAPFGVFALIAAVTAEFGFGILSTLGWYATAVLIGLALQVLLVYVPLLVAFARPIGPVTFFRAMSDVHLLAFSTSSSAAALPLCMETVRDRLGVSDRVTAFVLPLGTTINQHGTAIFLGVASLFIANVYGIVLSPADRVLVVLTGTLASLGTAAIPGAGVVMLMIVLKAVGVPVEGIALIFGIDRLLDMCRTVLNVTGDAVAALVIAAAEGEVHIGLGQR